MSSARSPVVAVAVAARCALAACAALLAPTPGCTHATAAADSEVIAPPTPLTEAAADAATPRETRASDDAASSLTAEARAALEQGELERATTLLERAIALRPDDGEACYWLAEAWWQRGEPAQAQTYHGLAARFLGAEAAWRARLEAQRARVGDPTP